MALDTIDLSSFSEGDLSALQSGIHAESTKRTVMQARKEGRCFATLEEIPSTTPEHTHKFEPREKHPGGVFEFHCSEDRCREDVYNCPACGYVPGRPEENDYDNMKVLSGSKGINYSCGVCGTHLGTWRHTVS